MIKQFLKITFWMFAVIFIGNLLFLDFVWLKGKPATEGATQSAVESIMERRPFLAPTPTISALSAKSLEGQPCQSACLDEIQSQIEKLNLPPIPATVAAGSTPGPTPTASNKPISYISIGSSGQTNATDWADIGGTDFYFDLNDYLGQAVKWEANLRTFLSGNAVSARIYDVTNSRAVDGSQLSTISSTSTLLRSGDLTIWRGNNLYRVQLKTASGDTGYLDTARLKIQ